MILSKQINFQNKAIFVLQFGLGLVGKAIQDAIKSKSKNNETLFTEKVNWSDFDAFELLINTVLKIIKEQCSDNEQINLNILWSAGKAGFSATEAECNKELIFFKKALVLLSNSFAKFNNCSTHFNFVSSAGGLFEGQPFITKESIPAPKRPYGSYKLSQEILLKEFENSFKSCTIYRPSSVYSNYNVKGRKGLLAVLIENGIANRESVITGSDDTQRDYVLDNDIGKFVAEKILSTVNKSETCFLIDGKSSSIQEIKIMVESMINRKLILRYSSVNRNSADMSFWPGLKPSNFNTTSLSTNVRSLYYNLLAG